MWKKGFKKEKNKKFIFLRIYQVTKCHSRDILSSVVTIRHLEEIG